MVAVIKAFSQRGFPIIALHMALFAIQLKTQANAVCCTPGALLKALYSYALGSQTQARS